MTKFFAGGGGGGIDWATQQENSCTKHAITNEIPVTAMFGRVNEALHWNLLTQYLEERVAWLSVSSE
jgi:hypothetical protein